MNSQRSKVTSQLERSTEERKKKKKEEPMSEISIVRMDQMNLHGLHRLQLMNPAGSMNSMQWSNGLSGFNESMN